MKTASTGEELLADPATGGRHSRRFALGLVLIALAGFSIRLGYALAGGGRDVSGDGLFYHGAANLLADGHGYVNPWSGLPTATHPPAWPLLLSLPSAIGFDSLLAHQVAACVVGTATVALVGLTGRLIAGGRVGLIAAAIVAVYPNLWVRERELAAETLIFPLAAIVLALAIQYWRAPRVGTLLALAGICGVLVLVHAAMVLLLIVLVPALVLRAPPGASMPRRWVCLLAALGVAGVVLLPWVIRNAVRFERPVLLTTNTGLTLRAANCPAAYEGERLGSFDLDIVRPPAAVPPGGCVWDAGPDDESEVDAWFRDRALAYARGHAERVPAVVAAREGRTWGLFRPLQQARLEREFGNGPLGVYRAAVFAYWVLLPFAIAGAVRLRRRCVPLLPLVSFLVVVAAAVGLTFGSVRYRAPAEVTIAVLAAVGIEAVWAHRAWLRSPNATAPAGP